MSLSRLQQRLELSRPLTGLELQDLYDQANRSVEPSSVAKPKLRRYAIAVRPVTGNWDNNDPVIINARHGFDNGWGVMFSETVGEWCVLYYISHVYRVKRKPYFSMVVSDDTDS